MVLTGSILNPLPENMKIDIRKKKQNVSKNAGISESVRSRVKADVILKANGKLYMDAGLDSLIIRPSSWTKK